MKARPDSWYVVLFLYRIFTQRSIWLIERLSEAMGTALVGNNFSPSPSKISFHMKRKEVTRRGPIELSQYRKSGSMFSSSEPVAATAANSETPCICARPSDPRKQCRRAAPWAWPLILPSKPSITFWNSLWINCQGLKLGLKLELCSLTNEL